MSVKPAARLVFIYYSPAQLRSPQMYLTGICRRATQQMQLARNKQESAGDIMYILPRLISSTYDFAIVTKRSMADKASRQVVARLWQAAQAPASVEECPMPSGRLR